MNNYIILEKQLIYIVNKLKNSQYFLFNKTYTQKLTKFKIEIIKEHNNFKCNFYTKFSNKFLFSKILKEKQ